MANSLRKVQDRARRSSIATTETETERSIKALFSERIVKGRPDLFVPSTPIPTDMDESEVSSPLGVLQNNVSGFVSLLSVPHVQFSQFLKQSSSASTDGDDQDAKQRDFNKRMGRSDAESSFFSLTDSQISPRRAEQLLRRDAPALQRGEAAGLRGDAAAFAVAAWRRCVVGRSTRTRW